MSSAPRSNPELPEATLRVARADAELEALLTEVGLTSYLCVPLEARGRSIGVLSLMTGSSGRRYGKDDLVLVEELGHRCALAIDNAWLQLEAQQALSVRNEFLSVAAHELKTPVTSLRGYAQVLLRHFEQGKQLDPTVLQRALHTLDYQSVKLVRLVAQLLDVPRIEAGKLVLQPTPVELAGLVRGLVEAAGMSTGMHTLVLRAPSELFAYVDALRLEQVTAARGSSLRCRPPSPRACPAHAQARSHSREVRTYCSGEFRKFRSLSRVKCHPEEVPIRCARRLASRRAGRPKDLSSFSWRASE